MDSDMHQSGTPLDNLIIGTESAATGLDQLDLLVSILLAKNLSAIDEVLGSDCRVTNAAFQAAGVEDLVHLILQALTLHALTTDPAKRPVHLVEVRLAVRPVVVHVAGLALGELLAAGIA